jgi:hypothetical protein
MLYWASQRRQGLGKGELGDNSLARLDNSMGRAVGLGKQNETLQSKSDFPNYSSTTCIYMVSNSWGCSLHTVTLVLSGATSSYG